MTAQSDEGGAAPRVAARFAWNDQNVVAGLSLIGLALVAYWASSDLRVGRLAAMGPGMLPVIIATLIAAFGVGLTVTGLMRPGERVSLADFSAVLAIVALGAVAAAFGAVVGTTNQFFGLHPAIFAFVVLYLVLMVWLALAAARGATWLDRSGLRGPVFVVGALFAFALTVKTVGLALAGPLLAIISGAASHETKPKELVVFAVVITALCIVLFKYALKLPMPVLIIPGVIYL